MTKFLKTSNNREVVFKGEWVTIPGAFEYIPFPSFVEFTCPKCNEGKLRVGGDMDERWVCPTCNQHFWIRSIK